MVQHLVIDAVRHGPVHILADLMTDRHGCETAARVPHPLADCAIISSHQSEESMREALKQSCVDVARCADALALQLGLQLHACNAAPIEVTAVLKDV